MKINALNIRKGLELNVPITDIFKNSLEPSGNIIAKEIFEKGWVHYKGFVNRGIKHINELFEKGDDFLIYNDKKTEHKVSESLTAYVYDYYMVSEDEYTVGKVNSDKYVEIEFVNNEFLDYFDFCRNIMDAQSFSGRFDSPNIKYSFVGLGDFCIHQYYESNSLIAHSVVHLYDFFIFYKNVLVSVGNLISGTYERDIIEQKKYLSEKEYKSLLREQKKSYKLMEKAIREFEQQMNVDNDYDEEF